jgi:hypothetical protein
MLKAIIYVDSLKNLSSINGVDQAIQIQTLVKNIFIIAI